MTAGGLCSVDGFVARGDCGGWTADLLAVHNAADVVIFASYIVIAVLIAGFIRRRHDGSLAYMFWLFGLFVLSCGLTHLVGFLTTWWPAFRFDAAVKVVCAILSVLTAALLVPMTPKVMRVTPVGDLYATVQRQQHEITALRARVAELEAP